MFFPSLMQKRKIRYFYFQNTEHKQFLFLTWNKQFSNKTKFSSFSRNRSQPFCTIQLVRRNLHQHLQRNVIRVSNIFQHGTNPIKWISWNNCYRECVTISTVILIPIWDQCFKEISFLFCPVSFGCRCRMWVLFNENFRFCRKRSGPYCRKHFIVFRCRIPKIGRISLQRMVACYFRGNVVEKINWKKSANGYPLAWFSRTSRMDTVFI